MLKLLLSFFGGGGTASAITTGAKILGLSALLPVFWEWWKHDANTVMHCVTWGEACFWGAILFLLVQIAHQSKPARPNSDFS